MAKRKLSSGLILLGILGLVVLAVLIAPAEENQGGPYSTLSAATEGARIVYDLSGRLGWSPERRNVEFDKDTNPAPVQVLIDVSPGAVESHALLEFVRRGGSLLVAGVDGGLGDSLHLTSGLEGDFERAGPGCHGDPFEAVLAVPRPIATIRWRQPPRSDTIGFGMIRRRRGEGARPAVGFALGSGRVIVVADADMLANDVVRICANDADVVYVRMMEYLTGGERGRRIAFDEFHHGSGIHGGSLAAIRQYMLTTPSGRMLGQVALAGLLLLFAAAPRPLAPRDPERIARRSPLEHADALAHAYMAVGATRTATARLIAGVRRRTRRGRNTRESDEQLLATAAATSSAAAGAARTIEVALDRGVPNREMPGVAAAVSVIEQALLSRPPLKRP